MPVRGRLRSLFERVAVRRLHDTAVLRANGRTGLGTTEATDKLSSRMHARLPGDGSRSAINAMLTERGGCSGQNEGVSFDEPWSDREKSDAPVNGDRASQSFDRDFWDERWSEVVREHPEQVAQRPPNAYLTETVDSIAPGRALDAGCGHGSDAPWLAAQGWHVTAVDFSKTALAHGRSRAEILGPKITERIAWVEGDLAIWTPEPGRYDLVSSLYVHVAGRVQPKPGRAAVELLIAPSRSGASDENRTPLVDRLPASR